MKDAFRQRWSTLKLFDKVVIYFFLILDALILLFHQNVSLSLAWVVILMGIILLILIIIPLLDSSKNRFLYFIRNWYIIIGLTFIYWMIGDLVHLIFPGFFDSYIISFEKSLFGHLPNIWIQKYENPVLTEAMQLSYAIYWFTIPVGAAIFYFKKRYYVFEYMLFFVLVTFFLSYLFFILIPVAGPRFAIGDQIHAAYNGIFATEFLRRFVDGAGLLGGAFPSSHVAVAIVVLFFVWKYYPTVGKGVFLPAVIALSLATVYGQYHYVTDVIAGGAMGFVIGLIGVRYSEKWPHEKAKPATGAEIKSIKTTL